MKKFSQRSAGYVIAFLLAYAIMCFTIAGVLSGAHVGHRVNNIEVIR